MSEGMSLSEIAEEVHQCRREGTSEAGGWAENIRAVMLQGFP